MTFKGWSRTQEEREGVGKMFHGNFWPNVEMDLEKGEFVERNSLIKSREELYNMADPEWMVENLKDDLALQMALFKKGEISDIDSRKLE